MTEGPEAWLIAADPLRVVRIDPLRVNYEFLGPRMASQAAVNFRILIDEILRLAPHLHRTPATRAWLDHLPAEQFRFADSAAMEHETMRHWLMLRYGP